MLSRMLDYYCNDFYYKRFRLSEKCRRNPILCYDNNFFCIHSEMEAKDIRAMKSRIKPLVTTFTR